MEELYVIGEIKPLSQNEIQEIENLVNFSLPTDYQKFLANYGFGEISGLINLFQPDENFVESNFGDCMDFWDLTENQTTDLLNGLTISSTIDGDVILSIDDKEKPIAILPRHSENLLTFDNFDNLINHYRVKYKLGNNLYFDPIYNFANKHFSLVSKGKLDTAFFDTLQQQFRAKFTFDKILNIETQPKYVIQKIGGWVYFDNVYKSSINVKYQTQFQDEVNPIIDFFTEQIEVYGD